MSWQPISSAPKNRFILVYRPLAPLTGDDLFRVTHMNDYQQTSPQGVKHYADCWCHPTHWMPIPDPPAEKEEA